MFHFYRTLILSLTVVFYIINPLYSQDFNTFTEEKDVAKKIKIAYEITSKLITSNLDSVQFVVKDILKTANEQYNQEGIVCGWYCTGNLYIRIGKEQEGINYLRKAKNYFLEKEDFYKVSESLNEIGNGYVYMRKYSEAIKWYEQSLEYSELIIDQNYSKGAQINLAQAYYNVGDYVSAKKHAESYRDYQLRNGASRNVANAFALLGQIEMAKDNNEDAITYFQQCFEFSQNINDNVILGHAYTNMGIALYLNNEMDKSLDAFKKGLEYRQKVKNKRLICDSYLNVSNIYSERSEYSEALDYAEKGLQLARENNLYMNEIELLEMQKEIYTNYNPKLIPDISEEIDVALGKLKKQRNDEFKFDADMLTELNSSDLISKAGFKKPYYHWFFIAGGVMILIFFSVILLKQKD